MKLPPGWLAAIGVAALLLTSGAASGGPARDAASFLDAGAYEEAAAVLAADAERARRSHDASALATVLPAAADAEFQAGHVDAAIRLYEEARAAAIQAADRGKDADLLGRLARSYLALGRRERARQFLDRALAGHEKAGDGRLEARDLRLLAELEAAGGDYPAARAALDRALELDRKAIPPATAADLAALARLQVAFGQDERAAATFEAARAAARSSHESDSGIVALHADAVAARDRLDAALLLYEEARKGYMLEERPLLARGVGRRKAELLWRSGQPGKAIADLDRLLAASRAEARQAEMAECLRLRGAVQSSIGRHAAALEDGEAAVVLLRLLDRPEPLAGALVDLGNSQAAAGKGTEAVQAYSEALALFTTLDRRDRQADVEQAVGDALLAGGKVPSAVSAFERAIGLGRQAGEGAEADRLEHAGTSLARHLRLAEARKFFERAVQVRERARAKARGAERRDYLASQIRSYDLLIGARLLGGDLAGAVDAFEESRARYLAETLRGGSSRRRATLAQARSALPRNAAILLYIHAPPLGDWVMAIRRDAVRFSALKIAGGKRGALESQVERFRDELLNPTSPGSAPGATARRMGEVLVSPARPFLSGVDTIVVVADGPLAFLPFEALGDEGARYLALRYAITYAPSLTVLATLQSRALPPGRRPLLAMGGPAYEAVPAGPGEDLPFETIRKRAYADLDRGGPLKSVYAALGLGTWAPLPGTLREVRQISSLFQDAVTFTGRAVNEGMIKRMAQDGTLAKFRMLHFAMHGIAVPEVPELSALIASQTREPGAEDGYLRLEEVTKLRLAADFVNLSACETALGKILRGEGVQSLAQAFLIAGANGVSASQWPISDEGTAKFMEALYRDIAAGKAPGKAMAATKRRFIAGEFGAALARPYFWAPFVYFGT